MRLFSLVGVTPIAARPPRVQCGQAVEGVLLETVAAIETLRDGWSKVRANKGGPGGDSVTIEEFAKRLDKNLAKLSDELLTGRYRPRRLRRASMPKPGGGERVLAIPAVVDRVAQTAMLVAFAPTLDPRMSDVSWAYRPGRGVRDALEQVEAGFRQGFVWTVDADIAKYFDRVPHSRLVAELTIWIDDERVIGLVGQWLHGFSMRGRGIAQGSPISPLLANLYLHPLDRLLVGAGYRVVRYADNLLLQAPTEASAKAGRLELGRLLNARGLSLNGAKTRIVRPGEAFTFLGQSIHAGSEQPSVV